MAEESLSSVVATALAEAGAAGPLRATVESTGVDRACEIQKACAAVLDATPEGRPGENQSRKGHEAGDLAFSSGVIIKPNPNGSPALKAETISKSPLGYTVVSYGETIPQCLRRLKTAYLVQIDTMKGAKSTEARFDAVARSEFFFSHQMFV